MELTDWECRAVAPGSVTDPDELRSLADDDWAWIPAQIPGTAAAALDAPGRQNADDPDRDDWWFRCSFARPDGAGRQQLRFDGLATLCQVWLNGSPVLSTDNMFRSYVIDASDLLRAENELVIRCESVSASLAGRKGRPRWKTNLVEDQRLRFVRTTLFGRQPGWSGSRAAVGPWRPVTLHSVAAVEVEHASVDAVAIASGGRVDVDLVLAIESGGGAPEVVASCDGNGAALAVSPTDRPGTFRAQGSVELASVRRWWPATHGGQPLYDVSATCTVGGEMTTLDLGRVGFRTLTIGSLDSPVIVVNDHRIFARGVCWVPIDPARLSADRDELRTALEQFRDAGLNLIRVTGTGVYESAEFHDLCDELGLLVWQDLMFARMDYPVDDPDFAANVALEVAEVAARLRGRPSTAVVCGGTEIAQQVAMVGREIDMTSLIGARLEPQVAAALPGVAYVTDTPVGGNHPFTVDSGFAHYFGVGGYRRPLSDARLCGVRFASECLAFSHLGGDEAVEEFLMGGGAIGDPDWKRGIPRDRGASWDFEDVRDHYVRELYGVDPTVIRGIDPDWYLDLGRGAVGAALADVLGAWRRPDSDCAGAIILEGRDCRAGAGPGPVDHLGRLKPSYHALRRVLAPVALVMSDEGMNGLDIWAFNDGDEAVGDTLVVRAFSAEALVAEGRADLRIDARASSTLRAEAVLGTFLDVTDAYRFGASPLHAVSAHWLDGEHTIARAVFRPRRRGPLTRHDVGLGAQARRLSEHEFSIEITAERLAECVLIESAGSVVSDEGFDLEPGGSHTVHARTAGPLRARVRALNADRAVSVTVVDD